MELPARRRVWGDAGARARVPPRRARRLPVVIRVGKGYVEACPKGINKGVMAERMIEIASRSSAASPKTRSRPAAARDAGGGVVARPRLRPLRRRRLVRRAHVPGARPLAVERTRPTLLTPPPPAQALHHRLGAKRAPRPVDVRRPQALDAAAYLGDHNDVVELLKMLSTLSGASRSASPRWATSSRWAPPSAALRRLGGAAADCAGRLARQRVGRLARRRGARKQRAEARDAAGGSSSSLAGMS